MPLTAAMLAVAWLGGATPGLAAVAPSMLAAVDASSTVTTQPPASATLATPVTPSSTVPSSDFKVGGIQVRQVYIKGAQQASLTLPDGNGRVVFENRLGHSIIHIGGHYNFYNGLIETWVTYAHVLWDGGPLVQVSASDHIGLGQLYFHQRSLERTREVPIAIGQQFGFGAVVLSASRASWLLSPLDAPATSDKGLIDSFGIRYTATDVIPDIAEQLEALRPDTTTVEYRRAFRDFSGDYGFERLSIDIHDYLRGFWPGDEMQGRLMVGHAWSVRSNTTVLTGSPTVLPIRETFGLGGASTLRGYQPGEFRGRGILAMGVEYALVIPWVFSMHLSRLDVWQTAAVVFADEGRIQDSWEVKELLHGSPFRWSGGMGLRFKGKWLNSHRSIVRLLAAQAGDYPARKPVFYALLDISDL